MELAFRSSEIAFFRKSWTPFLKLGVNLFSSIFFIPNLTVEAVFPASGNELFMECFIPASGNAFSV